MDDNRVREIIKEELDRQSNITASIMIMSTFGAIVGCILAISIIRMFG